MRRRGTPATDVGPARPADWRGEAAIDVMIGCAARLDLGPRVLVAGEPSGRLAQALSGADREVGQWSRRWSAAVEARPWPTDAMHSAALLRMPRSKDELDMMLHAVVTRVAPGGRIAVFGANDEGIKSVAARMGALLDAVETVETKAHCRVVAGRRPERMDGLRAELEDWRQTARLELAGETRDWIGYPGLFAHGRLDDGTRLLLSVLPALPVGARVLDFGCGTGLIGAAILAAQPSASLDLADEDTVALLAASQNVRRARMHLATGLVSIGGDGSGDRWDLIVSNPPVHAGKAEDLRTLRTLIRQAPDHLRPRGCLLLVVQARVRLADDLRRAFGKVEVLANDRRFCVYRASKV